MATQFCQKCKQVHPGRICDYDDQGECPETVDADEKTKLSGKVSGNENTASRTNPTTHSR